ncbi:MAG: hypothetical protein HYS13_05945 [Planctomycetia bacterium]|nr:hypothetical protein [Planctomycetia bacterium]
MIQSLAKEKEQARPETAAATAAPNQTLRTAVSLLLFIHLFALATALLFNSSTSRFRENLRTMPGFYLRLLAMDYDLDAGVRWRSADAEDTENQRQRNKARRAMMHLSHAEAYDMAYFVDFQFERDGERQTVGFPGDGLWGQRKRYYQLLTWEIGRLASATRPDDEDLSAASLEGAGVVEGPPRAQTLRNIPADAYDITAAVGRWMARRHGVTTGIIRCRPLWLLTPDNVVSANAADRDPWARFGEPVYAAQIIVDGDEVLVNRIGAAGAVAPAPGNSPRTSSGAAGADNNVPAPPSAQTPTPPSTPPLRRELPPEFRNPN